MIPCTPYDYDYILKSNNHNNQYVVRDSELMYIPRGHRQ